MNEAANIVQAYLTTFYSGRPEVRDLLADGFEFSGPSAHFHGADAFLRASGHAAAAARSVEIEKLFVDDGEVAAFYRLNLDHRVSSIQIAELFRVSDGRIVSSRLVMDTAPFLARNAGNQGTAIDPVCHMEVDKGAPAATREQDGTTYYFCSTGCAESFSRDPQRYLAG